MEKARRWISVNGLDDSCGPRRKGAAASVASYVASMGIARNTHKAWLASSEEYARMIDEARLSYARTRGPRCLQAAVEMASGRMELKTVRVKDISRPTEDGEMVVVERHTETTTKEVAPDSTILSMLLKAFYPDMFTPRSISDVNISENPQVSMEQARELIQRLASEN